MLKDYFVIFILFVIEGLKFSTTMDHCSSRRCLTSYSRLGFITNNTFLKYYFTGLF